MCADRDRRFARDQRAVSEVIGFILGFAIAFIVLVVTLYAFGLVAKNADNLNAKAHMTDLANRVSLGVQEALFIGSTRIGSGSEATSERIRYERELFVPLDIEGNPYWVSLTSSTIRVRSNATNVESSVPTFNAPAVLPDQGGLPASCTPSFAACTLSGDAISGPGRIKIIYEYDANPIPPTPSPTNRILIR